MRKAAAYGHILGGTGMRAMPCGACGDSTVSRAIRTPAENPTDQGPNATAYMIRPGQKVNRPAMTRAPTKMLVIALRCRSTLCRCAAKTASGTVASVKIDRRWIGLKGPIMRNSWIENELAATTTISVTQIQPIVRCGRGPLEAVSCTNPKPDAATTAKARNWMAGEAESSGARPRLSPCVAGDELSCAK